MRISKPLCACKFYSSTIQTDQAIRVHPCCIRSCRPAQRATNRLALAETIFCIAQRPSNHLTAHIPPTKNNSRVDHDLDYCKAFFVTNWTDLEAFRPLGLSYGKTFGAKHHMGNTVILRIDNLGNWNWMHDCVSRRADEAQDA